jgi:hypothetical protein
MSFDHLKSDYTNHYTEQAIADFYTANDFWFDEDGGIL